MSIAQAWKQRIVDADALDAVKIEHSDLVLPPYNRPGAPAQRRALRTPLIDQLREDPAGLDPAAVRRQVVQALLAGRGDEYIPFTGQSAGLITDIQPAARIIRQMFADAQAALGRAHTAALTGPLDPPSQ